ncbi:MAG TPA: hypothetical protein VNA04_10300 [Thermoanaerobaculia bacterium]|nr:hypothetical protein [Thermoanaerobaculia bacterium]
MFRPAAEPRYKRLPPRVLEPEHLWGFVVVLGLNLLVWAPYIIFGALLLAVTCDNPFTAGPHPLAPPPSPDAPVLVPR